MEAYKRGSHTVWDCKYHLVWVTKYRHAVLGGDVGLRCRELPRETAIAHEMVVHAGSVNRDHVHMLVSIPPSLSVSRAVFICLQYSKSLVCCRPTCGAHLRRRGEIQLLAGFEA